MKKTHIIGIVIIALAIGIIMATAGDASVYVSFKEAKELALIQLMVCYLSSYPMYSFADV